MENRCAHTPDRIQKPHRDRIIGQTHADESATDGIKPCETVRRTVRRNFSFPVATKKRLKSSEIRRNQQGH